MKPFPAIFALFLLSLLAVQAPAQSVSRGGGTGIRKAAGVVQKPGCKEGRQLVFIETIGEESHSVLRTCRNGSYYDLSNYNYHPKYTCKENTVAEIDLLEPSGYVSVLHRCQQGKWRPIPRKKIESLFGG